MKAVRAALFTLIAVAGSASAAGQSPWYAGADVGAKTSDTHGASGRAYVGYELGSGLAVNPQQVHALEVSVFSQGLSDHGAEARASGVAINWATLLKVSDKFSVSARLGAAYATATTRRTDVWSVTYDKPAPLAGVGMAYELAPRVYVTTDVTYMPIRLNANEKSKTPTLTLGLRYGF